MKSELVPKCWQGWFPVEALGGFSSLPCSASRNHLHSLDAAPVIQENVL